MQRTGECLFCHQTRMVEANPDASQHDVDLIATEMCQCPDGMKERNARKARMRAMDTIENLFVGSEEQIGELFRGAYDLVNNGEILKVTVKVSENRTYTESFNTREGAPQISMKEKQEATKVLA